jgi:hypothetical protein
MSYLMLSVIGIVLAAGAALVMFNFGGDYFVDAYTDSDAMDLENGLLNVLTAYKVHHMKTGSFPSDVSSMLPGAGSGTLDVVPNFHSGAVLSNAFPTLTIDGISRRAIAAEQVPQTVCLSMNTRMGIEAIPTSATGSIGCFWNGSQHLAFKAL